MDNLLVYPRSTHGKVHLARGDGGDVLVIDGKPRPADHEAAEYLRENFPFTAPTPVLRRERSFGVGDRLGIAGPGHLRVFRRYDAAPVLAQQSMRELKLTGRTYEDVLDAATFAVFREDYQDGFGADGDHLKTMDEVRGALDLGFSMITLDCSEHIRGDGGKAELTEELRRRYLDRNFTLEDGDSIVFTEDDLAQARHIYGDAVRYAAQVWERFFASGAYRAELEISIDETATPTTPRQHFFAASELQIAGVRMATLAPRFCGEFQKGIDYIGDVDQFDREMKVHAEIARHFGYKISVHSGSDKFSVFPSVSRHTRGVFHVKTAGTNWLEAMRVCAEKDPALYREAHAFALEHFDEARAYYHVSADADRIPDLSDLSDDELAGLMDDNNARQLIHITYGLILSNERLRGKLYRLWDVNAELYADKLERHIIRHMRLLGVPERETAD